MRRLTNKQDRFCEEYVRDSNATQAAIRAGYSRSTAGAIGSENLTKPDIQRRIDALRAQIAKRNEVSVDRVVAELRQIAFGGMSRFITVDADGTPRVDLGRCTEEDLDLLQEITFFEQEGADGEKRTLRIRIKPHSRLRALDALGRMLGMFDKGKPEEDPLHRLRRSVEEMQRDGSRPPLKHSP